MYPFIWSKGGGSQERVIVVEFMKLTEKLLGGALGAVEVDFTHTDYLSYTTWKQFSQSAVHMPREYIPMKYSIIGEHVYKRWNLAFSKSQMSVLSFIYTSIFIAQLLMLMPHYCNQSQLFGLFFTTILASCSGSYPEVLWIEVQEWGYHSFIE